MKKLLIGLMLLTSMSAFASRVQDIENKLASNVCGDNRPTNTDEYNRAIQRAFAAKSNLKSIEKESTFIKEKPPEATEARASAKNISSHIDSMLSAVMSSWLGELGDDTSAIDNLCNSLK